MTPRMEALQQTHLRWGWVCLLVFITMGAILEGLHGFKAGFYLSLDHQTRRELWTLAHAHGTLLGLLNLAFALTVASRADAPAGRRRLASVALQIATVLLPAGFFLGGAAAAGGDPGSGVLLVPLGALALIAGAALSVSIVLPGDKSGG